MGLFSIDGWPANHPGSSLDYVHGRGVLLWRKFIGDSSSSSGSGGSIDINHFLTRRIRQTNHTIDHDIG